MLETDEAVIDTDGGVLQTGRGMVDTDGGVLATAGGLFVEEPRRMCECGCKACIPCAYNACTMSRARGRKRGMMGSRLSEEDFAAPPPST